MKKYEKYKDYQPAVKASICSGEKVAGFIEPLTKKFIDIEVVKGEKEIDVFCKKYGIKKESIKYIW